MLFPLSRRVPKYLGDGTRHRRSWWSKSWSLRSFVEIEVVAAGQLMSNFFHHLDLTVSDPAKSRPLYELSAIAASR
jgi:hypothetical protein